ncbi:hypothetical protein BBOMB_1330 [Bifidobacterium bombi DSM 19703]|uniref:Uncharacterized protein n=1 Tax=Bifidobacterium bombi DSM 19703 TaxID=1341695 RepID=A0A086BNG8_9BIFI|nr:hypothetical protein BBOMB_1330 [Bifidobacterium bombi DSM 19703]
MFFRFYSKWNIGEINTNILTETIGHRLTNISPIIAAQSMLPTTVSYRKATRKSRQSQSQRLQVREPYEPLHNKRTVIDGIASRRVLSQIPGTYPDLFYTRPSYHPT